MLAAARYVLVLLDEQLDGDVLKLAGRRFKFVDQNRRSASMQVAEYTQWRGLRTASKVDFSLQPRMITVTGHLSPNNWEEKATIC